MTRVTSKYAHRFLLLIGVAVYVLLGVGRAVGMGLCFEADGHVELELMRAGGCASSPVALNAAHEDGHSEHSGLSSEKHCASCNDVALPFREMRSKGVAVELPVQLTAAIPATEELLNRVPVRAVAARSLHSRSFALRSLSTIVLRT